MRKQTLVWLLPLLLLAGASELTLLVFTGRAGYDWVVENCLGTGRLARHLTAAESAAENEDWELAEEEYTAALAESPESTEALIGRGRTRVQLDKLDEAIQDFTDAIALDDTDAEPLEWRGNAQARQTNYVAALRDFDAAVALDRGADADGDTNDDKSTRSGNSSLYEHRAFVRAEQGDLKGAVADYTIALKRTDGPDAGIAAARGFIYARLGQPELALADFDAAIAAEPGKGEYYTARARVRANLRQWHAAIKDCDSALQKDPAATEVINLRGFLRTQLGEWSAALVDFREAVRISPADAQSCNSLAWLQATAPADGVRDGSAAVPLAMRACQNTQWRRAGLIDTLAAAHAEAGDFTKAVEYQRAALALTPAADSDHASMAARLKLYERRQPFRDAAARSRP